MKNILLICGADASSSLIENNIQKAVKSMGKNVSVKASNDTELEVNITETDLLLVAPHLRNMLDDLKLAAMPYNLPVELINEEAYASHNGEAVLQQIDSIISL